LSAAVTSGQVLVEAKPPSIVEIGFVLLPGDASDDARKRGPAAGRTRRPRREARKHRPGLSGVRLVSEPEIVDPEA
jgi:hypothetical protein